MRCYCCNVALSDYESTLKSVVSGEYLDMCKKCLTGLNIAGVSSNSDTYDEEAPDADNEDIDDGDEYEK